MSEEQAGAYVRGEALREARARKKWTQGQLAEKSGVAQPQISAIEKGVKPDVMTSTIVRLARALGVSLDTLVGLPDGPLDVGVDRGTLAALYGAASERGVQWLLEHGQVIHLLPSDYTAAATGTPSTRPPRRKRQPRQLYEVEITGGCMRPQLEPGDTVVVDPDAEWSEQSLVIAAWNGHVVVKRVERRGGVLVLCAEDGTVLVPDDETRLLGVVIYTPPRT